MTKKAIVTTTINPPTEALKKFNSMDDWDLIVVGDLKTPHEAYPASMWTYLPPFIQEERYPVLSKAIGWNCIQRRNIGFVEAYRSGYDIIATVDDDNIPYPSWGNENDLFVGREVEGTEFIPRGQVFDPLSAVGLKYPHRGFPLGEDRHATSLSWTRPVKIDVQADLWHGSPDIDALTRIYLKDPQTYASPFNIWYPFFSKTISPFNSQNTFLSREVLPHYFMFPGIGRYDDIWAAYYVLQHGFQVGYGRPSVVQQRNEHDLLKDLENELYGMRYTRDFIAGKDVLPDVAKRAFDAYRETITRD